MVMSTFAIQDVGLKFQSFYSYDFPARGCDPTKLTSVICPVQVRLTAVLHNLPELAERPQEYKLYHSDVISSEMITEIKCRCQ